MVNPKAQYKQIKPNSNYLNLETNLFGGTINGRDIHQ